MERTIKKDFYIRKYENPASGEGTVTFLYPEPKEFKVHDYDWYITVALEKAEMLKEDRHLLTYDLIVAYRNAIREGYNHELDPFLKNKYDFPRNRNTIKGIEGYIKRMLNNE